MNEQQIYQNMKNEIIQLSENKLKRKLSDEELQHIIKNRTLIGLESVIDMIKYKNFSNKELEIFLISL
ncbi:MAG: hypothetical protein U9M94_02125 [Patescibacteria group bacterium]|nr:hypothetical protein [Patescibacteria group bacterium]